ncbi:hypothetical protein [Caldimonas brevitalea]|uniref:Uncharacterized protein n=1 Tax=Caldimonas brevitalea TaxID=413882 RepID=A0A0G3BQV7_9BURK|nr:hypothetical protein [Caldimonas brevitalea]AKJ31802.1 hypothetical protein AAW51_5111 [Caldimonas brevitalea]
MSPLLAAALAEAHALGRSRAWSPPSDAAVADAERLLDLVAAPWPAPEVLVEPTGVIALEWEAGAHGWLRLAVQGDATVEHSAVIEGDEYGQVESLSDGLPDWAAELLRRLYARDGA